MSAPPRPVRKGTLLPEYSAYPSLVSIKAAIAATIRPARRTSTESTFDSDFSPILSRTGRIIGPVPIIHSEPISEEVLPTAPPPAYSGSQKPVLLWLDGGGTKVIIETYFLADIMRRLAWDLKFSDDNRTSPKYSIPPKDCFDWIAGSGCSAVLVLAIACGMNAREVQLEFMEIAPALQRGSMEEIENILEEMIARKSNGTDDPRTQTNVWLPAEYGVMEHQGECILKGESINIRLLPIAIREIRKELDGNAEFLDCTEAFLHSVCPIFDDCSFLLSLGSGQVPIITPRPQTWWEWLQGVNVPSTLRPLPPSKKMPKTTVIPLHALSIGKETYIRLHPEVFRYNMKTKDMERLDDWTTDVTEFRDIAMSYMNKIEIVQKLNRAAHMLRWKEIPGPQEGLNRRDVGRSADSRTHDGT